MKDSYECHMTTRIGPSRTQSNMPNSPIPRKDAPKQSFPGSQVSATHQCRVNLEPADDQADYSLYIQKCKITQAFHSEDIHSSLVDAPRLLLVVAQHSQSTGSPQRRDLASFVRPIWGGRENPNFSTPCISSHQPLPLAWGFPFRWTIRTGSTLLFWAIT